MTCQYSLALIIIVVVVLNGGSIIRLEIHQNEVFFFLKSFFISSHQNNLKT
jgi:hypothetical protein